MKRFIQACWVLVASMLAVNVGPWLAEHLGGHANCVSHIRFTLCSGIVIAKLPRLVPYLGPLLGSLPILGTWLVTDIGREIVFAKESLADIPWYYAVTPYAFAVLGIFLVLGNVFYVLNARTHPKSKLSLEWIFLIVTGVLWGNPLAVTLMGWLFCALLCLVVLWVIATLIECFWDPPLILAWLRDATQWIASEPAAITGLLAVTIVVLRCVHK